MACSLSWPLFLNNSTFWWLLFQWVQTGIQIKDFGDSIPGHGGITDRMDCQVMAVFAYIYHQSFIVPQNFSIEMILDQIMMILTLDEQQALFTRLGEILAERRIR